MPLEMPEFPSQFSSISACNDGATLGVRWHSEINAITSASPSSTGRGLLRRTLGIPVPLWPQTPSLQLYRSSPWPVAISLLPPSFPSCQPKRCNWCRKPTPPSSSPLLLLFFLLYAIDNDQRVEQGNSCSWNVKRRESINNLCRSILYLGEGNTSPS